MPLINPNTQPTTLADKQAYTKDQLSNLITNTFNQLKVAYMQGKALVYNNRLGLTSDQVIAGLGADAEEFNTLVTLLKTTVNTAVPGTIPDDPAPASAKAPEKPKALIKKP